MPFKSYYMTPDGSVTKDLAEDQLTQVLQSGEGLLWVDVSDTTIEDGQFLQNVFRFHPLAVEDCVSENIHPPKVDNFGEYIFLILHGVNYSVDSEVVETAELAVFLGKNYVVSSHNFPMLSVEGVQQLVERDGQPMKQGADFLGYTIIDTMVDNIMPTIDQLIEIAYLIEESVVRNPDQSLLDNVLKLKRSTVRLHRVMAPQREVLSRISRGDFKQIGEEARIYYRDIYDHLVRIEDLNQTVRDMTDNALATYMSSISNKQNEVMKILSIVAAIFLPLGLLTGIFGMNFTNMPELDISWGYYAVLSFIAVAIFIIFGLFWARGWISWGRKKLAIPELGSLDKSKLVGPVGNFFKKRNTLRLP